MRRINSNFVCILLAIIVSFTGMCLENERVYSYFAFQNRASKIEIIDNQKNATLYIGNSTAKLITGLRSIFPKNQREKEKISLRNVAEMLLIKKSLQSFLNFWCSSEVLYLLIQNYRRAILNYIHNQDGEK